MASSDIVDILIGGTHAARPAATAVVAGSTYSCTDHGLEYQSDGATWTTRSTFGAPAVADIVDIPTAEMDDTLVLAPDGAGGVEFRAEVSAFDGTLPEIATPSTPSAGTARIYPKSDGRFYSIDDAGNEFGPFDAGGGGGGTDYIATIAAEANLLYYHPLNETSGTSFHDELGGTALAGTTGGNEVAVDGPPLQGDLLGGSAGFNNVNQKMRMNPITWPAQWTWEVWAFFLFNPANGIFGQWDGSGSMLFINGASDTRVYCGGSSPSWNATNAEIRGRHHILIGYDGTNVKLYWDGVQKISSAASNNSGSVGSDYQLGGVNGGGNGSGFVLSDSAFYNNFDSGRAAAHYALGHP